MDSVFTVDLISSSDCGFSAGIFLLHGFSFLCLCIRFQAADVMFSGKFCWASTRQVICLAIRRPSSSHFSSDGTSVGWHGEDAIALLVLRY